MLEPPNLPEEALLDALRSGWGFSAHAAEFLPLGNDATAWAFRARGAAGDGFVKLKRAAVYPPACSVPRFLHDQGLRAVTAPLPALDGSLYQPVGDYSLILYPYIEGACAMQAGLTSAQWTELGAFLRSLHAYSPENVPLPGIKVEDFRPPWADIARRAAARAGRGDFANRYQQTLAEFIRERKEQILALTARAEALGAQLRAQPPKFVLCHADIHTANLITGAAGNLHVVDWDGVIFAPKERDLMFVPHRAPRDSAAVSPAEVDFTRGYCPGENSLRLDPLAAAYYAYEWVVQEIGDFGERVFFSADCGEETLAGSVRGFVQLFEPGDVVEGAQRSDFV